MSDAIVKAVTAVQEGDTQAFGTLYDRYVQPIYRFIYLKTHHKPTAEDLTSLTFTRALEYIQSFDHKKGTFSSWLYQIARNTVTDHFRTLRPNLPLEDIWDVGDDADIERDTETAIKIERVRTSVAKLGSIEREIIIMRVWQGMSYREIAEALDKSEASCKMAYSRGIKKLRDLMPAAAYAWFLFHTSLM